MRKSTVYLAITFLFLIVCALFITLPHFPLFNGLPGRDAGVYLYMGQALNRGDIPYVDAWDHKGIVIYILNALAAALSPQSVWGMWLINTTLFIFAIIFSFSSLKKVFGFPAALISTLAWIFAIPRLEFMNIPEFMTLPFQFIALSFFIEVEKKVDGRWYSLGIGMLFVLVAFIRPNTIAIFIGIVLWWVLNFFNLAHRYHALLNLIFFALGTALSGAIFTVYFLLTGSLEAMLDAYLRYNALYSAFNNPVNFLSSIVTGFIFLSFSLIAFLGFGGWIAGLASLFSSWRKKKNIQPILFVVVFAFPVEILFASLSGRNYSNYYITWLPLLAYTSAFFVKLMWDQIGKMKGIGSGKTLRLIMIVLLVVCIPALSVAFILNDTINVYDAFNRQTPEQIAEFLSDKLGADDTMLVWGAETSLNYLTGTSAPTRYMYAYPLFLRGYANRERFVEFLGELQENPPKYIVDAGTTNTAIPPLTEEMRANWEISPFSERYYEITPDVDMVFQYVGENYELLTDEFAWPIYIRVE